MQPKSDRAKQPQERPGPAAYEAFIKGLEIKEILLSEATIKNRALRSVPSGAKLRFRSSASLAERQRDEFAVRCECHLEVIGGKPDDVLLEIGAAFLLEYSTQVTVSPVMFEMFKQTSLYLHVWPYFREFIQSAMVRCGVPSFTLPVVKIAGKDVRAELGTRQRKQRNKMRAAADAPSLK
ncbi:MAG: hypothetical protein V1694_05545 [Candidatus Eisenbacteria bacterium]